MIENKPGLMWHRFKLLALLVFFLSPFIGGWLALYVFDIRPESNNYGNLVQPPIRVNWPELNSIRGEQYTSGFGRKWTFLMFTRDTCSEQCRSNLYYMRQIRTLLGRDSPRLQNVLISAVPIDTEMATILSDYPSMVVIDNYDNEVLYSQFKDLAATAVGSTPRLYLVDPDQNYMMYYPAQADQYRILDDIKNLMKQSQIG